MEPIVYLVIGVFLGGALGFMLVRVLLLRSFVKRPEFQHVSDENERLKLESALKMSKEEVAAGYVVKEVHQALGKSLEQAQQELKEEREIDREQQSSIIRLQEAKKYLEEKESIFKDELEKLHQTSQEKFKNLASSILEDRQNAFVATNKREMTDVLDPFRTKLDEFRKKVEDTRKEDIVELTSLKKEIESLRELNTRLSEDATNLALALRADVKIQGNWGEDRLNMILESEGLQKYIDFTREEQYRDEEGDRTRKPDYILRLPNGKHIIIDSKVSLTAYVNYFNAETPQEKAEYLRLHLKSIVDHINGLADKNYHKLAGLNSPDYVFMFMPIESALTLAMNQNGDIFNYALHRKIVLITPTTLVATLKVVRLLWQKENQVKNVEEIFKECGALYDKFVDFLTDMDGIEEGLKKASTAYSNAYYKLKTGERKGFTIMGRFETIKRLEAKNTKTIPAKHLSDFDMPEEDGDKIRIDDQQIQPDKANEV